MVATAAGQDTAWAAELGKNLRLARWTPFFEGLAALYANGTAGVALTQADQVEGI